MALGDLKGHKGTFEAKIDKTVDTLELALRLAKRLQLEAKEKRLHVDMLQVRIEGARLTVKQAMLTLEKIAIENWESP